MTNQVAADNAGRQLAMVDTIISRRRRAKTELPKLKAAAETALAELRVKVPADRVPPPPASVDDSAAYRAKILELKAALGPCVDFCSYSCLYIYSYLYV